MNQYKLARMTLDMKEEYIGYISEWTEKIVPYYSSLHGASYEDWLRLVNRGIHVSKSKMVPSTIKALVDNNGRVCGMVEVRHRLTKDLARSGGHIGYGIRPSERGKGLGVLILSLALKEANLIGLDYVQADCYLDNVLSRKVIESNGGILFRENVFDGKICCQYLLSTWN